MKMFELNPNVSWRQRIVDGVGVTAAGAVLTMAVAMGDRATAEIIPMPGSVAEFVDQTNCNVQESMRDIGGLGTGITACEVRDLLENGTGPEISEFTRPDGRIDTNEYAPAPEFQRYPGFSVE